MAQAPTIRAATADDIHPLRRLVESAYRGDTARGGWTHEADLLGGQRIDAESLSAHLADPVETVLVACLGEAMIGSVQIGDRGGGLATLGLLAVDPGRQAAGLGRRLIDAAEAHARTIGATRIEMTVIRQRPELIAYYERRGYALTGEERPFPLRDARFGVPARRDLAFVVLAKAL